MRKVRYIQRRTEIEADGANEKHQITLKHTDGVSPVWSWIKLAVWAVVGLLGFPICGLLGFFVTAIPLHYINLYVTKRIARAET